MNPKTDILHTCSMHLETENEHNTSPVLSVLAHDLPCTLPTFMQGEQNPHAIVKVVAVQ